MSRRKIFVIGIPLVLIFLIGGFLILDKFFFHLFFKPIPGSCLILEEKYCKQGKAIYDNNGKLSHIEYKFSFPVYLFSPIDDNYSSIATKTTDGKDIKVIYIGDQKLSNNNSNLWYQILFEGSFVNGFTGSGINKKISKGDIFGKTVLNKEGSAVLLGVNNVSLDSNGKVFYQLNEEEIKKFISN